MSNFNQILKACSQIAEELPDHVFIGGVAVYLHAVNHARSKTSATTSHDADFMISLSDYSVLRQTDDVTTNRRLGKHQVIRDGVEFDVYVERQNNLLVPYDQAFSYAWTCGIARAACLEHLFVLKIDAATDRLGSTKGDKDERDLITIALACTKKVRSDLIEPYLRDEHRKTIRSIERGQAAFMDMAGGNVHKMKKLRKIFSAFVSNV